MKAILTKLHPHQKSALAWMVNCENKQNRGMNGGILADVSSATLKGQCVKFSKFNHRFNGSNGLRI